MPRFAWTTDIHLNFLGTQQIDNFLCNIEAEKPDMLVISGDIGESSSIYDYLRRIAETLDMPIYFVLGNHDYYHASISHVRGGILTLTREVSNLHWLADKGIIKLSREIAMVGHDAWADGRYGDFLASKVVLNDYVLIKDLFHLDNHKRLQTLNQLGDEAAAHFREYLPRACAEYRQVFVVLHPPPFQETCWHKGESARDDNEFLPHFACKAVGDVLLEIAPQYPDCQLTVLCGHTHGAGSLRILHNLHVLCGGAEYGSPKINRIFQY